MRRTITAAFLITLFAATIWGQEPTRNDPAAVEILEKYIAATGGRQAWSALKNVRDTTEVTVMGTVRNVVNVHERATGRFYTRTEQKDGLIESGYDGTHAWQRTPMFRGILKDTEPQALAAKRSGKSLVEYRESSRVFRREPDETVDGRKEIVLSSTEPDPIGRNIETRYYFDPQTYLLDQSVSGGAIKQTTRMEDYRKTPAGVLVPFTRTVVSPQVTVVTHVRSWEANVTIDPTIFSYDTNGSEPAGEKKAAAAPAAPVTPPVAFKQKDEIPEALRLATFEHVWQKVNDSYWDPTFGGIDWKKVHDDFLPRARAAKASDEYHRVLNDMVTQLGRSHFRVTRPDQTIGLHSQASDLQNYGFIGLSSQWIDDQLVATAVVPDFPAARAGIRKGYVIQKVNGKTPAEIYEMKLRESTGYHLRKEIALPRAVEELLAGRVGEPVEIDLLDDHDQPLHYSLKRKERPLADTTKVEFESKRLAGGVGYIRFNLFFGDVLQKFEEAIRSMQDAPAVIVDLRQNHGGAGDLSTSVASLLSPVSGSLGSSRFRYASRQFDHELRKDAYRGKVLILTDEGTASTSEVLAGGLQDEQLATIVGASTAGAVLPSLIEPLETGASLVYVVSDFRTGKGRVLEGSGVKADIEAHIHRSDLLAGRDPVIDRALSLAGDLAAQKPAG